MRAARIVALAALAAAAGLLAPRATALDIVGWPDAVPPDGVVGVPYLYEFQAEEGCLPYRFSVSAGQPPPGLAVTDDGKLTGTPTEAGFFEFYVAVDDSNVDPCRGSPQSQGLFKVIVLRALEVRTQSLPVARIGTAYAATLESNESTLLEWSVIEGALPPGLILSTEWSPRATISGTPTTAGSFAFTLRVNDLSRKRIITKQLTLVVAGPLAASLRVSPLGEVGVPYSASLAPVGGAEPYAWSVAAGVLPQGLSLDAAGGALAGVPRAAGAFPVTFSVTDAAGQVATVAATLRIAARLAVPSTRLPAARAGRAYRARLRATGGVPPVRWRIVRGTLPRGVRLDRVTGTLRGTPLRVGRYRVTVRAVDRLRVAATRTVTLAVRR